MQATENQAGWRLLSSQCECSLRLQATRVMGTCKNATTQAKTASPESVKPSIIDWYMQNRKPIRLEATEPSMWMQPEITSHASDAWADGGTQQQKRKQQKPKIWSSSSTDWYMHATEGSGLEVSKPFNAKPASLCETANLKVLLYGSCRLLIADLKAITNAPSGYDLSMNAFPIWARS